MVREHIQTLPEPLLLKLIEKIPHTGDRIELILHFIYGVDGSKGKVINSKKRYTFDLVEN